MKALQVTVSFVFDGIDDADSAQSEQIIRSFGKLLGQFKTEARADSVWFNEATIVDKHEVLFGQIAFHDDRAIIHAIDEIAYLPDAHIERHAGTREWIIPALYDGEIVWPTEEDAA